MYDYNKNVLILQFHFGDELKNMLLIF